MADRETGKENGQAIGLGEAVTEAVREFAALTGRVPDAVTGVRGTDDGGWSMLVDVVELERIPASTSVIGVYRVELDRDGKMRGYERLRRYNRGATDPS